MVCFPSNRRVAQEMYAAWQDGTTMNRTAPIRITSFCFFLLTTCGTWCQKPVLANLLRGLQLDGSNSTEVQHQELRMWRSLPDAPSSVQPPTQAQRFHAFANEAGSHLIPGAIGVSARAIRQTQLRHATHGPQPGLTSIYQGAFIQKKSTAFVAKYLYPSRLEKDPGYHASTSDSFLGRTSDAAPGIFIMRDVSGRKRLNISYFLEALASVAIHSANRPNRSRSTSATFSSFGSTVGSDAGMNVFHEFGPGIRQIVKGHSPKFVSTIEERFTRQ